MMKYFILIMILCAPAFAQAGVQTLFLSQRVNYQDPLDARTFQQRFFWNADLATDQRSPIFLVLCGEGECTPAYLSMMVDYASAFHGHLIALEHRYYGVSQPVADFSTQNLSYLNTDSALRDIESFIAYAKLSLGLHGKWIIGGASYPGTLAAFFRQKHPDLVVGAIASSAPVRASDGFYEADRFLSLLAGGACTTAIQSALQPIDEKINDPVAMKSYEKLFGFDEMSNPRDFMYMLGVLSIIEINYASWRSGFCHEMETSTDPLSTLASFALKIHDGIASEGALNIDPAIGQGRQWVYQQCTQFGFFPTANPNQKQSVFSRSLDRAYYRDRCARTFGRDLFPDVSTYNQNYYEPLFASSTSHILFTNGTGDYWQELSVQGGSSQANSNSALATFSIINGIHGSDLSGPATSGAVRDAQDFTKNLITQWLSAPDIVKGAR